MSFHGFRKISVLIAMFVMAALLVGSPASAQESVIHGTVTRASDGAPVAAKITVYRWGPDHWSAVGWPETDAAGNYAVKYLSDGPYRFCAEAIDPTVDLGMNCHASGTDPAQAQDVVVSRAGSQRVDFALTPGSAIRGRVTKSDGSAMASARVAVLYRIPGGWWELKVVLAGANGRYVAPHLGAGTYKICAYPSDSDPQRSLLIDGWCLGNTRFPEDAADTVVATDTDRRGAHITFPAAGTVEGLVTDGNGKPLDTWVTWYHLRDGKWTPSGWQTSTGADGTYALRRLPPGPHRICVGFVCHGGPVFGKSVNVAAGTVLTDKNIRVGADRYKMRLKRAGHTSLTWQWKPVAGATSYQVRISPRINLGAAITKTVTGTEAVFGALRYLTHYYADVRAVGPDGPLTNPDGPLTKWSRTATATTTRHDNPPEVALSAPSSTSVSASWWASSDPAAKVAIQLATGSDFGTVVGTLRSTGAPVTFNGLQSGKWYFARVRAVNSAGKPLSDWSTTEWVRTP